VALLSSVAFVTSLRRPPPTASGIGRQHQPEHRGAEKDGEGGFEGELAEISTHISSLSSSQASRISAYFLKPCPVSRLWINRVRANNAAKSVPERSCDELATNIGL
jgi:hypothetical protein